MRMRAAWVLLLGLAKAPAFADCLPQGEYGPLAPGQSYCGEAGFPAGGLAGLEQTMASMAPASDALSACVSGRSAACQALQDKARVAEEGVMRATPGLAGAAAENPAAPIDPSAFDDMMRLSPSLLDAALKPASKDVSAVQRAVSGASSPDSGAAADPEGGRRFDGTSGSLPENANLDPNASRVRQVPR